MLLLALRGIVERRSPFAVAVIDDDQSMRKSLERLLAAHGFVVWTFPSAEAFLDIVNSDQPACLVVDIDLPGISGLELLVSLTACGLNFPTIVITATDDEGLEALARRLGCIAYLCKPFAANLLITAIRGALDGNGRLSR